MTAAASLDAFLLTAQADAARGSDDGLSPAARVVALWHNDNHAGAFRTCRESLCDAVRRVER